MMQPGAIGAVGRVGLRAGVDVDWLRRATLAIEPWRPESLTGITCGRTSTGTYWDANGVLQTAAAGVTRVSYDPANLSAPPFLLNEGAATNQIRNPRMVGAVAGVIGAGGSMGTTWGTSAIPAGITATVLGVFVVGGIQLVRVRFSGTPSSGAIVRIDPDDLNATTASNGQAWSGSWFLAVAPGSAAVSVPVTVRVMGRDSASTGYSFTDTSVNIGATVQRVSATVTMGSALVTRATTDVRLTFNTGVFQDFTIDIGPPQLEQGSVATSPILPPEGTIAASTRSADNLTLPVGPWYDPAGGTWVVDYLERAQNAVHQIFYLQGPTTAERINMSVNAVNVMDVQVVSGGSDSFGGNAPTLQAGRTKAAFALSAARGALSVNGSTPTPDTTIVMPVGIDRMGLGATSAGGQSLNSQIHSLYYIPPGVPDSALPRLSR